MSRYPCANCGAIQCGCSVSDKIDAIIARNENLVRAAEMTKELLPKILAAVQRQIDETALRALMDAKPLDEEHVVHALDVNGVCVTCGRKPKD